jgi:predicted kinase
VVEKGVTTALPDPALVVLVGASGSGKSAWAAARYRPQEVVSSDQLRGVVGSGEHDLDASADAFALLDQIVAARLKRGLNTVVDTLGLDPARRRAQLEAARRAGLPAVAVLFDTDPALCRSRNAQRDRSVPAAVLDGQLRRVPGTARELDTEGWDLVARPAEAAIEPAHSPGSRRAAAEQDLRPARLSFVLQISRFGWQDDPPGWLAAVAGAAADAGIEGIALMDHLIQIPQAGRAWEPIPEPWVTLGLLAGLAPGLRLGTLVTPVTFRAPGILAKTVATLDVLTGGRAFCGIGAGWWDREHAAFGLPFPPPATRLDQLEVTIETLRALWQPGTKAYQGTKVWLPETTCYPRRAAHPADRGAAGRRLQPAVGPGRAGPQAGGAARALPRGRPGPGAGAGDRARHPRHRRGPGARRRARGETPRPHPRRHVRPAAPRGHRRRPHRPLPAAGRARRRHRVRLAARPGRAAGRAAAGPGDRRVPVTGDGHPGVVRLARTTGPSRHRPTGWSARANGR